MNVLPCNVLPKQVDLDGAVLTRFLLKTAIIDMVVYRVFTSVSFFSRKTLNNI